MDILNMINLKDENGNFNPAALLSNIDKIEPMLPMINDLMQSFKPEGSDGVFLMGSIEDLKEHGSRPVLRLMGYKVITEEVEGGEPKKSLKITSNCMNKQNEPIKIDLLALIVEAGNNTPEKGGNGLDTVLG